MENWKTCRECGAALGSDDIAINLKLISRNVTEFFCIDCLAAYYKTTREVIQKRIGQNDCAAVLTVIIVSGIRFSAVFG